MITHSLVVWSIEQNGYNHSIYTRGMQAHDDRVQKQPKQPQDTVFHHVVTNCRGAQRMRLLRLLIAQPGLTAALLNQRGRDDSLLVARSDGMTADERMEWLLLMEAHGVNADGTIILETDSVESITEEELKFECRWLLHLLTEKRYVLLQTYVMHLALSYRTDSNRNHDYVITELALRKDVYSHLQCWWSLHNHRPYRDLEISSSFMVLLGASYLCCCGRLDIYKFSWRYLRCFFPTAAKAADAELREVLETALSTCHKRLLTGRLRRNFSHEALLLATRNQPEHVRLFESGLFNSLMRVDRKILEEINADSEEAAPLLHLLVEQQQGVHDLFHALEYRQIGKNLLFDYANNTPLRFPPRSSLLFRLLKLTLSFSAADEVELEPIEHEMTPCPMMVQMKDMQARYDQTKLALHEQEAKQKQQSTVARQEHILELHADCDALAAEVDYLRSEIESKQVEQSAASSHPQRFSQSGIQDEWTRPRRQLDQRRDVEQWKHMAQGIDTNLASIINSECDDIDTALQGRLEDMEAFLTLYASVSISRSYPYDTNVGAPLVDILLNVLRCIYRQRLVLESESIINVSRHSEWLYGWWSRCAPMGKYEFALISQRQSISYQYGSSIQFDEQRATWALLLSWIDEWLHRVRMCVEEATGLHTDVAYLVLGFSSFPMRPSDFDLAESDRASSTAQNTTQALSN
jgi:hypothetical protein